jgi:hypothetical protein
MRFAYRLTLLAITTTAAFAFTVPTALAGVEITDEAGGGDHCTAVSVTPHGVPTGGCVLRLKNEGHVELAGPFGTMIRCHNDFEARVDENGTGYIYDQILNECEENSLTPCGEAGGIDIWPINITEVPDGDFQMEYDFCISLGVGAVQCHLAGVAINVDPNDHTTFDYRATNGGNHKACENNGLWGLLGHWSSVIDEAHSPVEFAHHARLR